MTLVEAIVQSGTAEEIGTGRVVAGTGFAPAATAGLASAVVVAVASPLVVAADAYTHTVLA